MPDGETIDGSVDETPSATDTTESTPDVDAEFYKAEAKKAFAARDKLKADLRRLQDSGLSEDEVQEYRALKQAQEEAERRRLEEKGEFEKALEKTQRKYQEELSTRDAAIAEAQQKLRNTVIGLAFAQADEWFGDNGRTVLVPEIAEAYFSRYVDLGEDGVSVVVKDVDGDVIIDPKTGRPAAFSQAIGELIDSLPSKSKILRGSGKAGSGSSGGTGDVDVSTASRAEMAQRAMQGDPEAIKFLRRNAPAGTTRSAWDRLQRGA